MQQRRSMRVQAARDALAPRPFPSPVAPPLQPPPLPVHVAPATSHALHLTGPIHMETTTTTDRALRCSPIAARVVHYLATSRGGFAFHASCASLTVEWLAAVLDHWFADLRLNNPLALDALAAQLPSAPLTIVAAPVVAHHNQRNARSSSSDPPNEAHTLGLARRAQSLSFEHLHAFAHASRVGRRYVLADASVSAMAVLHATHSLTSLHWDLGMGVTPARLADALTHWLPHIRSLTVRDSSPGVPVPVSGKLVYAVFGHRSLESVAVVAGAAVVHSSAAHARLGPRNPGLRIDQSKVRSLTVHASRWATVGPPADPMLSLVWLLETLPVLEKVHVRAANAPAALLAGLARAPAITDVTLEFTGARVDWSVPPVSFRQQVRRLAVVSVGPTPLDMPATLTSTMSSSSSLESVVVASAATARVLLPQPIATMTHLAFRGAAVPRSVPAPSMQHLTRIEIADALKVPVLMRVAAAVPRGQLTELIVPGGVVERSAGLKMTLHRAPMKKPAPPSSMLLGDDDNDSDDDDDDDDAESPRHMTTADTDDTADPPPPPPPHPHPPWLLAWISHFQPRLRRLDVLVSAASIPICAAAVAKLDAEVYFDVAACWREIDAPPVTCRCVRSRADAVAICAQVEGLARIMVPADRDLRTCLRRHRCAGGSGHGVTQTTVRSVIPQMPMSPPTVARKRQRRRQRTDSACPSDSMLNASDDDDDDDDDLSDIDDPTAGAQGTPRKRLGLTPSRGTDANHPVASPVPIDSTPVRTPARTPVTRSVAAAAAAVRDRQRRQRRRRRQVGFSAARDETHFVERWIHHVSEGGDGDGGEGEMYAYNG